jgi:ABC-type bacteriocin/lantibiotic exporter with double-glycine peptidase domain
MAISNFNVLSNFIYILRNTSSKLLIDGYKLVLYIFISVVVDLASLGFISLYIKIISDLSSVHDIKVIGPIFKYLDISTQKDFFIYLSFLLIFVTFIKVIISAFVMNKQITFSFKFQKLLSKQVLSSYLNKSYSALNATNSSIIIRNTISEVNVISTGLLNILFLITELIICFILFFMLLYFDWRSTILVIIAFGTTAYLFSRLSNKRIFNYSNIRVKGESDRLRILQESIGSIKEIKLRGLEDFFIENYYFHTNKGLDAASMQSYITQLPRLLIDMVAVLSIVIVVFFAFYEVEFVSSDFSIDGLLFFVAAAYRVMPSINKILVSLTNITSAVKSSSIIFNILQNDEKIKYSSNEKIYFNEKLEFRSVSFSYEGQSDTIFSDLDFSFLKGEFVAIVGQSGVGKSTLLDLILGLRIPINGNIYVDNLDISNSINSWRSCIGYIPQKVYLLDESIKKNVALGVVDDQINYPHLYKVLNQAQLSEFIDKLPSGVDTIVGEDGAFLSGGQKQRIAIARALYFSPSLLILDESTNSLDSETEIEIINLLKDLRGFITVIFVKHGNVTTEFFDKIYKIENKKLELI